LKIGSLLVLNRLRKNDFFNLSSRSNFALSLTLV